MPSFSGDTGLPRTTSTSMNSSLPPSVVSSILIATLHDGYNDTVDMSAFMAAKAMRDAVSSVTDTSVSVIGNTMIREYLTCDEEGEELLPGSVLMTTFSSEASNSA